MAIGLPSGRRARCAGSPVCLPGIGVGTSERIGASVRPSDPDDREQGWTAVRKRSKTKSHANESHFVRVT